jgi:hypothetical protein
MAMIKEILSTLALAIIPFSFSYGQERGLLDEEDLTFLEGLTKVVIDSSTVEPEKKINDKFGPNSSGGALITPGGRGCYPSFWIRDYAMSLDCGMIDRKSQLHHLLLTASTQCTKTWTTKNGSTVPFGAIADHIRIDDLKPIYFPGTYSYEEQGTEQWGKTPPYTDQYCFIHMAYVYVRQFGMKSILKKEIKGNRLIDRMEWAFNRVPADPQTEIVVTTNDNRAVDFGFRDAVKILGKLSIASVFKYRASKEMEELFTMIGDQEKAKHYGNIAALLKNNIPEVFVNEKGLLIAGTEMSRQGDVWSTALAVYYGILEGKDKEKACRALLDGYQNGTLSYKGNIRHVMTDDDFSEVKVWEGGSAKGRYQNGAYWGTPVGWVCHAIAQVDESAAKRLAKEYIDELREDDFRKGGSFGAPYECFTSTYSQNPIYMTSVSVPLSCFLRGDK